MRSLMRGQADLPELTGLMPLNMLIEMGIEKIKKDSINIFQGGAVVAFLIISTSFTNLVVDFCSLVERRNEEWILY